MTKLTDTQCIGLAGAAVFTAVLCIALSFAAAQERAGISFSLLGMTKQQAAIVLQQAGYKMG